MKITIDIIDIIKSVFKPVIDWLGDQGLWDPLVKLYGVFHQIALKIMTWLHISGLKEVWEVCVKICKFILNIFVTLLDVLTSIATWVLNILK
ncbi:MAG: hypothetical protein KBC26_03425 [Candidatus Pacebacteria bacterium]|nr:hypothetical protein [Candidatus Paceibacterota bacterium]